MWYCLSFEKLSSEFSDYVKSPLVSHLTCLNRVDSVKSAASRSLTLDEFRATNVSNSFPSSMHLFEKLDSDKSDLGPRASDLGTYFRTSVPV